MTSLFDIIDATWTPEEIRHIGGWRLRRGNGGGQRVSAATLLDPAAMDIDLAEAEMRGFGQVPLFMIQGPEHAALDAELAARGYSLRDTTLLRTTTSAALIAQPDPHIYVSDHPLAIMDDIWAAGGVDAGRLAVMARVKAPKTYLLGRLEDSPAATGFAAIHDGTVMVHALQTADFARRHGLGRALTSLAARWALSHGAEQFALAVTKDNLAANALYAAMGLEVVGQYHYRRAPED